MSSFVTGYPYAFSTCSSVEAFDRSWMYPYVGFLRCGSQKSMYQISSPVNAPFRVTAFPMRAIR
eukprot:7753403-Alexandrium_andersonii.AAC.1